MNDEPDTQKKKAILEDEFDIPMTETLEGRVSEMCNLSEGVWERGITQGRAEGRAEGRTEGETSAMILSIRNLMKSMNLSEEQAMDALMIPSEEREKYLQLLSEEMICS